ncbi:hypothetical protein [Treponema endosymbiont of Eucomonympha sp.]|uniref:hypothetical protein n=1 Tax=Treponema endosymbiont of Eucomonympha sp. TaxID=1580831 RepID=UPI0007508260|nr:hypothetical protein [Treponema endosymbiont of Eucomonympha sp.]
MTAHRQGIAVKPMYYIEIHGVTARPDATFGGVFEPLIGFYALLIKFYASLRGFYESLIKSYEWLRDFYESLIKSYESLRGFYESFIKLHERVI